MRVCQLLRGCRIMQLLAACTKGNLKVGSGSDALLQLIDLAVAAEALDADGV
jgi:hypothetical protein